MSDMNPSTDAGKEAKMATAVEQTVEQPAEQPAEQGTTNTGPADNTPPAELNYTNVEVEPLKSKITDLDKEILKQVEFYFSSYNLPQDKYLKVQSNWPKNGFVELKVLMSFNKMKEYAQKNVETALAYSTILEFIAAPVPRVRRRVQLPNPDERHWNGIERTRSIYVKGFSGHTSQHEITAIFVPYGAQAVRMRTYYDFETKTKSFKGSVFVEFKDKDARDEFLALDTKPDFKGDALHYEAKEEYCDRKAEVHAGNNKERRKRGPGGGHGRGRGRGRGQSRGRNDSHRGGRGSGDRRSRSPAGRGESRFRERSPANWNDRRAEFQKSKQKEENGVDLTNSAYPDLQTTVPATQATSSTVTAAAPNPTK